jgi:cellulose 1,4-beta-cellobiosidase
VELRARRRYPRWAIRLACPLALLLTATGPTLALMSASESSGSNAVAAATLANPAGFTATAASATSANLGWTAPSTLTGYALAQSGGTLTGCPATPTSTTTSCTATGLSPATTYTWTLQTAYDSWLSSGTMASAETQLGATDAGNRSFSCAVVVLGITCNGPGVTVASGTKLVVFANVQAAVSLVSLGATIGGPVSGVTSLDAAANGGGVLDSDNLYAWSATDSTGSGTVTIMLSGVMVAATVWLEVVALGPGESALACTSACTASGTGTTVTVQSSVTHATDSELVFLGSANGATFTAPTAFTTLAGGGTNSYGSYSQLVIQSSVSPAFTASSSSASWASIAVEVDP